MERMERGLAMKDKIVAFVFTIILFTILIYSLQFVPPVLALIGMLLGAFLVLTLISMAARISGICDKEEHDRYN